MQNTQAEVDAIVQAHHTSVLKEEKAIEAAMAKVSLIGTLPIYV